MTNLTRTFHLYRYQIVPTVEDFQLDFVTGIQSREELINKKNDIFAEALKSKKEFIHPRAELTHQLDVIKNFFVIRLAARRKLIRITKELQKEELDNWPDVYIIINNHPKSQLIAVEGDPQAFYRTTTIINILESNLTSRLKQYKLEVRIEPTFIKKEFWRIVNEHKNKITSAEFFMIAPNLANISKGLRLDLDELKKQTNSINTNVSLNSPKGEGLKLSEDEPFTGSLVGYASRGGGTIHLKIKIIRKKIKTEDSVKSIEIDGIYFSGDNIPEQLVEELKRALR